MSKRTKFLLGIGVIAALIIGWQVAAFAVHDEGKFELDGNATSANATSPVGPADDWDRVCHQVDATACPNPTNTNGASAVAWDAELDRSASIFTGGGSKDPNDLNQWAWKNGGGLPDKDNLLHAFAARYPTSTQDLLYFGSDRYDNSGDAVQGFWFFQNDVGTNTNGTFKGLHKDDDLLILSDFSNGGGTSTIGVYKWDAPGGTNNTGCTAAANNNPQSGQCAAANLRLAASSTAANCKTPPGPTDDRFCGIVNSGTIQMPWSFTDKTNTANNGAINGEFFEGGVDLTALGLGGKCFASFASETRSSTSPTATLKDFITGSFGQCGSSVATQSTPTGDNNQIGAGTAGVSTSDSATVTVSGAATWNGTVQFSLTGPIGSPLEDTVNIGNPVAVSNSTPTVQSPGTNKVTAVGQYCWSATFVPISPSDLEGATDDGANECFTVTPRTPVLDTDAGSSPVDFGQSISDTATLNGTANQPGDPVINPTTAGAPAGGNITFSAYGPDNCTTVAHTSSPVTVSGDGTYGPVSFTPNAPGTFHWKATYAPATGDPNNLGSTHNDSCDDTDEDVVVNQAQSTISTNQRWLPNDSATISAPGGGNLSGTVRFRLYDNNTCSGTPLYDSNDANGPTITVSGASPQTVSSANTTALTDSAEVSWLVEYTSNNQAQTNATSACNTEHSSLTIDNDTTQP